MLQIIRFKGLGVAEFLLKFFHMLLVLLIMVHKAMMNGLWFYCGLGRLGSKLHGQRMTEGGKVSSVGHLLGLKLTINVHNFCGC